MATTDPNVGHRMDALQLDTSSNRPSSRHAALASDPAARHAPATAAMLAMLHERLAREILRLPLGRTHADPNALCSLLLELPQLPTAIAELAGAQFHFLRAQADEMRAGFGIAAQWQAQGGKRLHELARVARLWRTHWERLDPDASRSDAFAMLGFAAQPEPGPQSGDPLPNALLWVPEIALRQHQGRATLIFSSPQSRSRAAAQRRWTTLLDELIPALFAPQTRASLVARIESERAAPDAHAWISLVEQALTRIHSGQIDKLVLSRRLEVTGNRRFEIPRLLDVLTNVFPSCQIVNLRREDSNFVAATPERLLHLDGRQLAVDAIAGTIGRSDCNEHDRALGEALRHSRKNLREHRFVIDAVSDAIASCCQSLQIPAQPELMQLRNAQHLWSPITAQLEAGTDLFDLAERLHPTPATNGQPRRAAQQWLRAREPFTRGWYTGAAGFITPETSGELWVLLRCARIQGAQAELYAGAGIVAGSNPEAEWEETEAKLAAMRTALQFA